MVSPIWAGLMLRLKAVERMCLLTANLKRHGDRVFADDARARVSLESVTVAAINRSHRLHALFIRGTGEAVHRDRRTLRRDSERPRMLLVDGGRFDRLYAALDVDAVPLPKNRIQKDCTCRPTTACRNYWMMNDRHTSTTLERRRHDVVVLVDCWSVRAAGRAPRYRPLGAERRWLGICHFP